MARNGRTRAGAAVALKKAEIKLSARINPELRKRLKIIATEEGLSIQQKLHLLLCRELGRHDLIDAGPDA